MADLIGLVDFNCDLVAADFLGSFDCDDDGARYFCEDFPTALVGFLEFDNHALAQRVESGLFLFSECAVGGKRQNAVGEG